MGGEITPNTTAQQMIQMAIQVASVSAERAFSSGGVTISKRHNRPKGDIVEALQFLKSSLRSCRNEILFPEVPCLANEPALIDDEVEEEAEEAEHDGIGI
jgi:hypothetical protein